MTSLAGTGSVEFFFLGAPSAQDPERTEYPAFNLNGVTYSVGDCATLYPEVEGAPNYIARLVRCVHDRSGRTADAHCVEVAWYERRANLDGSACEREVVELEEVDVNPCGCISGKCVVVKASSLEEAERIAGAPPGTEVFFCRGIFKQSMMAFVPYPELVDQSDVGASRKCSRRGPGGAEVVADSEDTVSQKRPRCAHEEQPAQPVRRTGKLVSGRTCVECGATQTPQWREGPAGPKTLCNACGVRYVRAQQRANKRAVVVGAPRGACGAGGRTARSGKGARGEAARGAARAPAAAPPVVEEVSPRPPRQAALLAATKTAQYARTGIFPHSAHDLQPLAGGAAQAQQAAAAQAQEQAEAEAPAEAAQQQQQQAAGAGGAGCAAPGTPNCSSNDSSSGSVREGVTVEVVVGPVDGDADCRAAARLPAPPSLPAASAFGPAAGALHLEAAGLAPPPPQAPLPQQPLAPFCTAAAAAACRAGALLRLPSDAPVAAAPGPSSGCLLLAPGHHGPADLASAALRMRASGGGAASPGLAAAPCLSGASLAASDAPAAAAAAPQHRVSSSAPVSPGGASAYASAATACFVPCGGALCCAPPADAYSTGAAAALQLQLHAAQQAQQQQAQAQASYLCGSLGSDCCSGAGGLALVGGGMGCDDDFGPLMDGEVDFGLGPGGDGLGLGCEADGLFAELQAEHDAADPDPASAAEPCAPAACDPAAGLACLAELPAAAAAAEPYCAALAPGGAARRVLDGLPSLVAAAAGDGPAADALPGGAVGALVGLSRQASRAASEAAAADAALQAVSQVLEVHQEAARRARQAAAAALAEMGGLIDLRDLTGGGAGTVALPPAHAPMAGSGGGAAGAPAPAPMLPSMLAAGCGAGRDGAAPDFSVAVHS